MSIFKAIKLKIGKRKRANLSGIIKYVLKTEKTEEKLVYGQFIEISRAYKMMVETKEVFKKTTGREYFHFVQSYSPDDKITPELALEQAKKFLEATKKFRAYEVLLAVHRDRENIHVHYIVNSVSFLDGRKFHISKKELEQLKNLQNEINIRDGFLPAPQKGFKSNGEKRTEKVVNDKNTYQLLTKAEAGEVDSYVLNCAIAVLKNKDRAVTVEQFITLMKESEIDVVWDKNKKHVTFVDLKRQAIGERKCKIRLATLAKYYPEFESISTKEDLLNVINGNNAKTRGEFERISGEFANFQRIADAAEGAERARREISGKDNELARSSGERTKMDRRRRIDKNSFGR